MKHPTIRALAIVIAMGLAVVGVACGGSSSSNSAQTPAAANTLAASTPSVGNTPAEAVTTQASNTPAASNTPSGSSSSAAATSVTLMAKDLKYDKDQITLAPNTQTTVTLDNQDNSVMHNFSIYTSSDASTSVFKGDLTTGPTTKDYTVPPLKPGTYYFRCDVHPDTMHGTLTVPGS
ncbi:MAG TPA: cupredoxin domain-containing protein [Dehalococcoidia bacterium]|nr:cupredoxin domain-containing protein [Dehalococcoidia bacterium]